ncbi:hypothetical protein BDF14DRAFT_1950982 [Spinellus fusiger]|nr:hypothetical protein BDF14DRAFT_1950982 [Spinellus fusiger]
MTNSGQLPLPNNQRPSVSSSLPRTQSPAYSHHLPSIPPKKPSTSSFSLPPPRGSNQYHVSVPVPASALAYTNASPSHPFGSMVGHSSSLPMDIHSMPTPPSLLPHPLAPYEVGHNNVARASSPTTNTSPPSQDSGTHANYRPLNVRDALTYLDLVKVRFSDQPDVYNRFLDIMKDFKSQSIDTPGVIERVSTLFKGHPTLVSGFNTFLPPGYRIECSTDPCEPDMIRVTTPSGVTTTAGGSIIRTQVEVDSAQAPPMINGRSTNQSYYQMGYGHNPLPNTLFSVEAPLQHSKPPVPRHELTYTEISSRPVLSVNTNSSEQINLSHGVKKPPIEFNHAINYVNKIKNRFAGDPDTYKQFLEILQMYQKDEKAIHDVYSQVQYLFSDSPDLLQEFKLFLPDTSGQSDNQIYDFGIKRNKTGTSSQNEQLAQSGRKKKMTKRSRLFSTKDSDTEMPSQTSQGLEMDSFEYESTNSSRPSVSVEEEMLFDRIRKHIGNKPSYEEFLKTLNLYSQQIVDMNTLIDQVEVFLGNNKRLFDWFKTMVGYEPTGKILDNVLSAIPKPDIMHCKNVDISPSYRAVPKSWQNQPCSGRDQLCWEVLNDAYISHPIWASEDSGFVTSKKNQYEEALHRVEEERYDYDLNIEANHNVIALLEPIVIQLEAMSVDERANFRLEPGLGGQSVSIYTRVIKKVYEKERADEIIEMLYNNPVQVAPILLKRLKKKNEEWIKAQYEWNGIWRELDSKNFYRALDYQGAAFKGNDRKAIVVKSLVTEIETLHHKQHITDKTANHLKQNHQFLSTFQDQTIFKDITRLVFSFIDNQSGFTNNDREKIRTFIQTFIPMFFHVEDVMPEKQSDYTNEVEEEPAYEEDEDEEDVNTSGSEESETETETQRERGNSPVYVNHSSGKRRYGRNSRNNQEDETTMGLLRDVLTKNTSVLINEGESTETPTKSPSSPESSANLEDRIVKAEKDTTEDITISTFPKEDPSMSADAEEASDRSSSPLTEQTINYQSRTLFAAAAVSNTVGIRKRTTYNFFCNSNFYCLFRLYEMLYERLMKMKKRSEEIKSDPRKGKTFNRIALDLGFYSHSFEDIDLSTSYYTALLTVIDRFFEGELDQIVFEESVRYIFVTEAYTMFTIDKLVLAIIKQIQTVTIDTKSVELIKLFRGDQSLDTVSPRTLSVYRLRAEDVIGSDENLYRINLNTLAHTMTTQLLGKDEYMLEPTAQDQYEDYVASYMDWACTTEGIDTKLLKSSFLYRNIKLRDLNMEKIHVRSRLQYKISQQSYHMFYIIGSEDLFIRPLSNNSVNNSVKTIEPSDTTKDVKDSVSDEKTISRWQEWLQSPTTGWGRDLTAEERLSVEASVQKLLMHGGNALGSI